jgi:hypothetical protein
MIARPVHGHGAAIEQHENDGLAERRYFSQELFLNSGNSDIDAITALKAFHPDSHFFAFEPGRQAEYEDDGVSLPCGG